MNLPFRQKLKSLRSQHQMSQARLARLLRTSRGQISALETGRRNPGPAILARLAKVFGIASSKLGALPGRDRSRHRQLYRKLGSTLPEIQRKQERPTWVRILHARRAYPIAGALLAACRARPDRKSVNQLVQDSMCGSRDEAMVLLHALASGGRRDLLSVMRLGYRELPVIDDSQRIVGDRPQPALTLPHPVPLVLVPQVQVRLFEVPADYPYRSASMDFLVVTRVRGFQLLVNLEINGNGHNSRLDQIRAGLIGLPRLVVTPSNLQQPDFMDWLRKQLARIARHEFRL